LNGIKIKPGCIKIPMKLKLVISGGVKMNKTSEKYYDLLKEKLYTAVLADTMDKLGYYFQTMDPNIRPLFPEAVVVGRAATMLCIDSFFEEPEKPYELLLDLLDDLKPGEVVVCGCSGEKRPAVWGELLSTHCTVKGSRGAIIDGGSRDIQGIIKIGFPVFCNRITPEDQKLRQKVIEIRTTISVGGVKVKNGDLVFADYDGCVVVPTEIEDKVIEMALEKVSGENTVREILKKGASIKKVFDDYGIL
jgi:4-hydroxy-4-methyl-2-oxoglutarate aldolase